MVRTVEEKDKDELKKILDPIREDLKDRLGNNFGLRIEFYPAELCNRNFFKRLFGLNPQEKKTVTVLMLTWNCIVGATVNETEQVFRALTPKKSSICEQTDGGNENGKEKQNEKGKKSSKTLSNS